jgi:hypothetical protein
MSKMPILNLVNGEFFVRAKREIGDIIKEWGAVAALVIPLVVTVVKEISS